MGKALLLLPRLLNQSPSILFKQGLGSLALPVKSLTKLGLPLQEGIQSEAVSESGKAVEAKSEEGKVLSPMDGPERKTDLKGLSAVVVGVSKVAVVFPVDAEPSYKNLVCEPESAGMRKAYVNRGTLF